MPDFDIVRETAFQKSFRTSAIVSAFSIDTSHIKEQFKGSIDIEGKDWNIGLIVGGSGTGKSTIARELFPDAYIVGYEYGNKPVADEMPQGKTVKEIEMAFTSVGFASPPSWLKPYRVLSNGEKMRADLARAILEDRDLFVFDEFTSVVNREVAKTGSLAIQKAVRRAGKQFIAVSCHKDITEWLMPDWIYDTDEQRFFTRGESSTAPQLNWQYTGLATKIKQGSGMYLGSITI